MDVIKGGGGRRAHLSRGPHNNCWVIWTNVLLQSFVGFLYYLQVWWRPAASLQTANTQATHGTQRMTRNATQDKTRFNHHQAYSTTVTLHPVLAGMMKTCSITTHRIVPSSLSAHEHLPLLIGLFPSIALFPLPHFFPLLFLFSSDNMI